MCDGIYVDCQEAVVQSVAMVADGAWSAELRFYHPGAATISARAYGQATVVGNRTLGSVWKFASVQVTLDSTVPDLEIAGPHADDHIQVPDGNPEISPGRSHE